VAEVYVFKGILSGVLFIYFYIFGFGNSIEVSFF